MTELEDIKKIAEIEFGDIVSIIYTIGFKLRIELSNKGFIDVFLSDKFIDRFSYHWECKDFQGSIYRYDNFPDKNWQSIETFPYHFHNGSQNAVEASPFALNVIDGFREFMTFVQSKIK